MTHTMGWVALYSQSGSELEEIMNRVGEQPTLILTDRVNEDRSEVMKFWSSPLNHKIISGILANTRNSLITLHGYLRILPPEALHPSNIILNGHPGDIINFPELKGFNPQKKAIELGLPYTGTVIHHVTSEVDNGPIIAYNRLDLEGFNYTEEEVCERLKKKSVKAWEMVLGEQIENWDHRHPWSRENNAARSSV